MKAILMRRIGGARLRHAEIAGGEVELAEQAGRSAAERGGAEHRCVLRKSRRSFAGSLSSSVMVVPSLGLQCQSFDRGALGPADGGIDGVQQMWWR